MSKNGVRNATGALTVPPAADAPLSARIDDRSHLYLDLDMRSLVVLGFASCVLPANEPDINFTPTSCPSTLTGGSDLLVQGCGCLLCSGPCGRIFDAGSCINPGDGLVPAVGRREEKVQEYVS